MKPGRPPVQTVERHTIPVKFYLNDEEYHVLSQEAKAHSHLKLPRCVGNTARTVREARPLPKR